MCWWRANKEKKKKEKEKKEREEEKKRREEKAIILWIFKCQSTIRRIRGVGRCEYFINDDGVMKQCGACNNAPCKGGENGKFCEYT
jgi:hypothetical protein